jgi:hypothetical protein
MKQVEQVKNELREQFKDLKKKLSAEQYEEFRMSI